MPATCAVDNLRVLLLMAIGVDVELVVAEVELCEDMLVVVVVGVSGEEVGVVEADDVVVDFVAALLLRLVDLVDGVATTIEPELTTRVATIVACVSGAALGWLLHMPYAVVTSEASV